MVPTYPPFKKYVPLIELQKYLIRYLRYTVMIICSVFVGDTAER